MPQRLRRACWPRWRERRRDDAGAAPAARRRAPSRAPPPMTRRSSNWFAERDRRDGAPRCRAFGGRLIAAHCAMARTRTRRRRSIVAGSSAPASPPRGRSRARNSPTTTSTTPTRLTNCVAEFDPARTAACAIIKHANPCGVAVGDDLARRLSQGACLRSGLAPSAASSRSTARSTPARRAEIAKIFTEVIIAPDADEEAIAIVAAKKNLRLLLAGGLPDPRAPALTSRSVAGGFLVQTRDNGRRRRHAS